MSLLVDWQIEELCTRGTKPMLSPFNKELVRNNGGVSIPSYGLSACGYDITCAPEWKVAKEGWSVDILDSNKEGWFDEVRGESITIPPHGFVLARTNEYFRMPINVMGSAFCKSTLARCGLDLPPTVIEPGWHGHLVLEIYNKLPRPVVFHANMGAAQVLFFKLDKLPQAPYSEGRKYQGQTGITVAR